MAGSGFGYAFHMDFGAGRFEYSFGTGAPRQGRREAPADRAESALIHPGFRAGRSVVLHRFGTDPEYQTWRAKVPGRRGAVRVEISERNPTPLFGAGLIDAIPDEAIEAAARRRPAGASGVRGRVARLKEGRVGRFGWKAQTETLEEFVLSAAASEVGLEVPGHHQAGDPRLPGIGAAGLDMDRDECAALVAYVRALPAPVEHVPADAKEAARIEAGGATFAAIGCAACHLPKLGDVEGIYSDLLLHDMGPKLVDTGSYGVFVAQPGRGRRPRRRGRPARRVGRGPGPGVAHAAALGPARLRPLPARRPRRHDRPGHRAARRSGCGRGPALCAAFPPFAEGSSTRSSSPSRHRRGTTRGPSWPRPAVC